MLTRINIDKDDSGNLIVLNPENIPSNWVIDIFSDYIRVISLSNANTKRERITKYDPVPGSLFLYNSTTDFYSFYRTKEVQTLMDKYLITKIVKVKPNEEILILDKINRIRYAEGFDFLGIKSTITDDTGKEVATLKKYKLNSNSKRNFIVTEYLDNKFTLYTKENWNILTSFQDLDNIPF